MRKERVYLTGSIRAVDKVKSALVSNGYNVFSIYDHEAKGTITYSIITNIKKAHVFLAVFLDTGVPGWALYELGIANGLQKRCIVIGNEIALSQIPLLANVKRLIASEDTIDAVIPELIEELKPYEANEEHVTEISAQQPLLDQRKAIYGLETQLIEAFTSKIRHENDAIIKHGPGDDGSDVVLWVDSLQNYTSNPILIEFKMSLRSNAAVNNAIAQLRYNLRRKKCRTGILIDASENPIGYSRILNSVVDKDNQTQVFVFGYRKLMEELDRKPIATIIKSLLPEQTT